MSATITTPAKCEICGSDLDAEGICNECGWNAYAVEFDDSEEPYYDEDDFDPDKCPDCGQDIVFGVCINSECMWRPEDDADEDGTP